MRERDNVLLAFANVAAALSDVEAAPVTLDTAKAAGFPKGWVVSDRAPLDWSDDNKRVFFGAKAQVPAPDTARAPRHRRARQRGRLEHRRRARAVAADDPRRAGSQLHVPPGVRRRRGEVREARRRDDARARRRAGRPLGGRARHPRIHPRLQARGRRHLSRQHLDRRADADAEGAADQHVNRQPHLRHLARRTALPLLEGQQVPGLRPRCRRLAHAWRGTAPSFVDLEFDHPGPKPAYGITGYTDRQEVGHRPAPLRPVGDAARRIGAEEPDRRRRREGRDALPLRPDRAARAEPRQHRRRGAGTRCRAVAADGFGGGRGGARGGARDHRSVEADPSCPRTANTRRRRASTSSPTGS